ncbi:MAG: LysR family transcriptional regulator, partial [Clostridia bacterium]|nr:LysR family transcriptional regulator [Clostridia bacterium]
YSMVNLELYRVFYTVAKLGSSTRAAEELFISQPAVSQAIKQLESQLGTTLFNRTHMGMELSLQGGKLIFKKVEEALRLLEEAESELSELKTTATGTIRIGATDAIFSYVLADKIVNYNAKYPGVKIELITGTTPETIEQLKEGKCDVGFLNLPVDDKDVNFTGTVAHLSDVFVAGKKFEHLKGIKVNLADLQQYPMLMIESNTVARRALAAYTQTLGIQLHPDIEVENWDLMLKFASCGMGIGCVPREYAQTMLDSGELFEIDVVPNLPVRGVGIALPKNIPVQFALKEFINMF